MSPARSSIGVIGKGFVGTVIADYYRENGYYVKSFDIKGNCDSLESVARQDIIFLAIMLPDNGLSKRDKDNLDWTLGLLPPNAIVVIKSTVAPGTTLSLQREHGQLNLFFSPEFLTEATAREDFRHPPFTILGVTYTSNRVREKLINAVLKVLPASPPDRTFVIGSSEAEMLKMVRNSYLALKLTAFNQIFDVCSKAGVDYGTVRDILAKDNWIGDSHNIIWHKGKRGFSGKCLPKDLHCLINFCNDIGVQAPLFACAEELNARYLAQRREPADGGGKWLEL